MLVLLKQGETEYISGIVSILNIQIPCAIFFIFLKWCHWLNKAAQIQ